MRSSCARLTPIFSSIGRTTPSLSASSAGQQVQRVDLRIAALGRQLLRALDGFLGFDR